MRQSLSTGQIIQFNNGKKFIIQNVCGMGASSIVYDARTESGERIRIKECYPISLPIKRNEKLELIVSDDSIEQFNLAKEKFKKSFELQKNLRDKKVELTNSIMPIEGLYSAYDTLYMTSVVMEGTDFSQHPAKSLISLIRILKSVAKVVNIYHEIGYLHLDIKPTNIFRIPETDEHIMMFDFDSLIEKKSLKNDDKIIISYSKKWAAPELISSDWNKICEATDVYAIGAIFFYSVFGREVSVNDRLIRAKWDYNEVKNGILDNVNPEIYAQITEFLHRTIVCNVNRRFADMRQVIAALDEIEKLSDQEKHYIYSRYKNGISTFIGRKDALCQISEQLKRNNILAIVGMGGIGKTELVSKYTSNEKEYYSKIVYLNYQGSIKQTVCSDDLLINKFECQEGQTEEDYYHEKIKLLHKLFCKNDLLIIDNYDDEDEDISDIMSLSCKIILTTRNDLRDMGISCLYLDKLDELESLELFRIYNEKKYDEDNRDAVRNILKIINYHTLTIELISKYLQYSTVMPEELVQKLNDEGNIGLFDNIDVISNKDGCFKKGTVATHIKKLYSIADLSDEQKEIMLGLSLMINIKISRRLFGSLFPWIGSVNDLNELINKSWVKYDRQEDKIYLHPLIQQTVALEKPDTVNCKCFLETLIQEYDKAKTNYENKIWRKLFECVFKQISGEDYLYGILCIREGSKQSLMRAKEIFENDESNEYMEVILKLFKIDLTDILDEDMDESEWYPGEEGAHKVEKRVDKIIDRFKTEVNNHFLINKAGCISGLQVDYLIEISKALCDELEDNFNFIVSILPRENLCKKIFGLLDDVYDYICSLEQNDKLEKEVAISALLKLEELFYPDFNVVEEYLIDEKKLNWLKKELRKYREEDPRIGMDRSIIDKDGSINTYIYGDGDELTINTITGHKEWENTWYERVEGDGLIYEPLYRFFEEDNSNSFSIIDPKREEVGMIMKEEGADELWYYYYCAIIDSYGKASDEADSIWMEVFDEYYYNLRYTTSGVTEIAMECIKKVSRDYYINDWNYVNSYCCCTIELKRMEDCRNCYTSAIDFLLTSSDMDRQKKFFELCNICTYAEEAGYDKDGIRCLALAVICLASEDGYVNHNESLWNVDDCEIELLLQNAFEKNLSNDIINDINWMYENSVMTLKENKKIYELIKNFLLREKYKDIDFITTNY